VNEFIIYLGLPAQILQRQVSEIIWQKAASPIAATHVGYIRPDLLYTSCHLSRRRMHSSTACTWQTMISAIGGRMQEVISGGTLQWACRCLPQMFPSPRGDLDLSNTMFLEPLRVCNPSGISIGSVVVVHLACFPTQLPV